MKHFVFNIALQFFQSALKKKYKLMKIKHFFFNVHVALQLAKFIIL